MKRGLHIKSGARASGRRALKVTTLLAIALAVVLAALTIALGYRLDLVWEMSIDKVTRVSERTRDMLANTQGALRITCFMDRRHPMFRPVSRLLRGLQQAARSVAGADITINYVDPRWDLVRSGQLVAQGMPENSLLFERQRRKVITTLDEMIHQHSPMLSSQAIKTNQRSRLGVFRGESVCAAAIARLALPFERTTIYWLQGHGEIRCDDDHQLHGFSDIAREIRRNGFELKGLDITGIEKMPEDCQTIIIAGPRYALKSEELILLERHLQSGGALLYLAGVQPVAEFDTLLAQWGIEMLPYLAASRWTLSGGEVVVSYFADHAVTRGLKNTSLVLGAARCMRSAANSSGKSGLEQVRITLLAQTGQEGWGESAIDTAERHFDKGHDLPGPVTVAAAAERGGSVAREVAFRPTRICVIGSTDFVMNGALASRANANRDFFMNAVAWLTGVEIGAGSSLGGDATLVTGFARDQWILLMSGAIGAVPAVTILAFALIHFRRGR